MSPLEYKYCGRLGVDVNSSENRLYTDYISGLEISRSKSGHVSWEQCRLSDVAQSKKALEDPVHSHATTSMWWHIELKSTNIVLPSRHMSVGQ